MKAGEIERAAVIGGGLMGAGIAQILAQGGCHVFVVDLSEEALEKCFERLRDSLDTFVDGGLLAADQADPILSRVEGTTSLDTAVRDARFVVEAVVERLDVKQEVFERLDRLAPPEAILATNTSGLRVGDVAERTGRPDRVVGSHFFYPPTIIPLVEVARGRHTSDETVATTVDFWRRCGKVPVVCRKDRNGFLLNRLQSALAREAMSLVANGVAGAADVDRAIRYGIGIRMPLMGTLEQRDWSGLDVHCAAAAATYPTLEDTRTPLPILADKVARGELGVKSGKGFYDWTGKDMEAVRHKRQQQMIRLVRFIQEMAPEQDDLVENG